MFSCKKIFANTGDPVRTLKRTLVKVDKNSHQNGLAEAVLKASLHSISLIDSSNNMHNIVFKLALAATILLGGCATKGPDGPPATASAKPPESVTRTTTPVAVPAAAARKVIMSMTGPKNVVEAKDWTEFKTEWRATFAEHAKAAGIEFSVVDGDVRPQGADGTILLVYVADYRMVGIGARIFLGVMTGNAFIDAKISFTNLRDGAPFGEQQHNTTSSAWSGVFAKVTPQQVDTIATAVFQDLKAAR